MSATATFFHCSVYNVAVSLMDFHGIVVVVQFVKQLVNILRCSIGWNFVITGQYHSFTCVLV